MRLLPQCRTTCASGDPRPCEMGSSPNCGACLAIASGPSTSSVRTGNGCALRGASIPQPERGVVSARTDCLMQNGLPQAERIASGRTGLPRAERDCRSPIRKVRDQPPHPVRAEVSKPLVAHTHSPFGLSLSKAHTSITQIGEKPKRGPVSPRAPRMQEGKEPVSRSLQLAGQPAPLEIGSERVVRDAPVSTGCSRHPANPSRGAPRPGNASGP